MPFVRDETRRKLDERAKAERWTVAALLTLSVTIFAACYLLPSRSEQRTVLGVVRYAVVKVNPETGQRYADAQVQLEDGRLVSAASSTLDLPKVHDTVRLTETKSVTAFRPYMWHGPSTR